MYDRGLQAGGEALDLGRLASDLAARGVTALVPESVDAIVRHVAREARPGDTIALLSNGAFGGIVERMLEALDPSAVPVT